jgi:predicted GIY-YIG superfamily endonuclease
MEQVYWVYILRCADGSYYTGCTGELPQRYKDHKEGRAAKYTARRRPLKLVYSERHQTMDAARRREQQIKRWKKQKKEALIKADIAKLTALSKRRASQVPWFAAKIKTVASSEFPSSSLRGRAHCHIRA